MTEIFRLPRLKAIDRIVDAVGRPTLAFIKWFNTDVAGAIERQEAAQAAVDVALQAQIDRLNAVLAGTEPFVAVNVGGTIIAEDAGLAVGVVDTAALSVTAVRPGAPATNAAAVAITGLDAVGGDILAAGAATVVTASFTVPVAGDVTLACSASFNTTNNTEFEFALLLDYTGIANMAAIRTIRDTDPSRYRKVDQPDPAGGPASIRIVSTVALTAGAHTATVLGMDTGGSTNGSIPAGSASIEVFVR